MTETEIAAHLESIKREQYRLRTLLESFEEELKSIRDATLHQQQKTNEHLHCPPQGIDCENIDDRLQSVELKKINEEWMSRAIDYLKGLENGLSNDNLSQQFRKALKKTATDFIRVIQPLGLDIIQPEPGDRFDQMIHEALEEETPGCDVIKECRKWGFRSGNRILYRAHVVLGSTCKTEEMSRPEAHIFPWRESLVVVLVAILVFWVFFKKPDIQTVVETKEIQVPVYIEVTPEPGVSKQEMLESSPSEYHPSMSSDVTVDGSPYQELIPWLEYQVKRGDTLWSLSRRFYDDPHKYLLIKSANNLKEDRIECGQKLIIPGGLAANGD